MNAWLAVALTWALGTTAALAALWRLYGTHYVACLLADRILWWTWTLIAALAIARLGAT